MPAKTMLNEPLLRDTMLEKEIEMENRAVEDGVARYRKAVNEATERGDAACLKPAERFMLHWVGPMVAAIKEEHASIRRGEASMGRCIYGPLMLSIDPERLAVITIHEVLGLLLMEPTGVSFSHVAYTVGRSVMAQANMELLGNKVREQNSAARERGAGPGEYHALTKRLRSLPVSKVNYYAHKELDDAVTGRSVATHTGSRLLWIMIQQASSADYSEPFRLAIHHERRALRSRRAFGTLTGRHQAIVRLDESVAAMIAEGHEIRQFLRPRYYPMVVEPFKWTTDAQGGYVRIRTPLVIKVTKSQREALAASDMGTVYECMDAVASTPWRVNRKVLAVMQEIWRRGGDPRLGIPHADDEAMPDRLPDDADPDDIRKRKRERVLIHERNIASQRDRRYFIRRTDIARELSAFDRVWYPHQLDFRGRAYPIPQILNHQGDDQCRGLLEFADARPITTDAGREALMIEVANAYGVDKVPYSERVEWAADHAADIARSALTPFDTDWWVKADAPWQCLAACMALSDPEAGAHAVTRRDGTCNGLQNYAALGRDSDAAALVNMVPGDRPSDIYSIVAEELKRRLAADSASPYAARILPIVTRKATKAPVMTTFYGVTEIGERRQAFEFLRSVGYEDVNMYAASRYLRGQTSAALGGLASGAMRIMGWLTECARVVASKSEASLKWKTPLGFPVVQSYHSDRFHRVTTVAHILIARVHDESAPLLARKHIASFPPNFIHSIDASHMFLTARECRRAGITFAAVHDNFWTHAEDRPIQDRILREQFVALHERPILTDLHQQLQSLAPKSLPPPPDSGSFDIRSVIDSAYFFN